MKLQPLKLQIFNFCHVNTANAGTMEFANFLRSCKILGKAFQDLAGSSFKIAYKILED